MPLQSAIDVPDVRMSARKGVLVVYGKGGKIREVPIHPQLRDPLTLWLDERPRWKRAATGRALFLNRRGGRLSARAGVWAQCLAQRTAFGRRLMWKARPGPAPVTSTSPLSCEPYS